MNLLGQLKRIAYDLLLALVLLFIYSFKLYEHLPVPLQLISVKILLVSLGFLHAHITRKLAFPSVDWELEEVNAKNLLVIALYVVFIYAYANAG
ncbi:MAG: hypothetical protein QXX30_01945 [Candidatus Aenigmatarchaeota archaeon]